MQNSEPLLAVRNAFPIFVFFVCLFNIFVIFKLQYGELEREESEWRNFPFHTCDENKKNWICDKKDKYLNPAILSLICAFIIGLIVRIFYLKRLRKKDNDKIEESHALVARAGEEKIMLQTISQTETLGTKKVSVVSMTNYEESALMEKQPMNLKEDAEVQVVGRFQVSQPAPMNKGTLVNDLLNDKMVKKVALKYQEKMFREKSKSTHEINYYSLRERPSDPTNVIMQRHYSDHNTKRPMNHLDRFKQAHQGRNRHFSESEKHVRSAMKSERPKTPPSSQCDINAIPKNDSYSTVNFIATKMGVLKEKNETSDIEDESSEMDWLVFEKFFQSFLVIKGDND